jgi:O-antigen/teichoic acid export membrane protein
MRFSRDQLYVISRSVVEVLDRARGYIIFVLLLRFVKREGYGIWQQLEVVNGFIIPIGAIGLGYSIVKFVSGDDDKPFVSSRLFSSMTVVSFWSAFLAVLVIIAAPLLNSLFIKVPAATLLLRVSALLIPLSSLEILLDNYFRARLRIVAHSVLRSLQACLSIAAVLLVFKFGQGLPELITSLVVVKFIHVSLMFIYITAVGEFTFKCSFLAAGLLKQMILFGLPVVFMGLSSLLYGYGDRMVIGYFMDISYVGLYGSAYTLAAVIFGIGAPFWNAMFPLMASAKNNDNTSQLYATCRKYNRMFSLFACPALVGLVVLHGFILLVFSSSVLFQLNPMIFTLIALGLFINQYTVVFTYMIFVHNEPTFLCIITVCTSVFNIACNIFAIQHFGIFGAAMTTFLTNIILATALYIKNRTYGYSIRRLFDFRFTLKSFTCALIMGIVVWTIQLYTPTRFGVFGLAWLIAAGMITYTLCFLGFNRFNVKRALRFKNHNHDYT